MTDFMQRVKHTRVPANQVAIFWLGQAGFLLKTHDQHTIVIDPYLSDCVERMFPDMAPGFKRLMPPPCKAADLHADIVLISHEHGDHFDVDSICDLMDNRHTRVLTNSVVAETMQAMPLDANRISVLRKGDMLPLYPGCTLTVTDSDHGDLSPEALGFLLDFGFQTVYFAGDTALTPERLAVPLRATPGISLLPINGAFGNLNGAQAARYAGMLKTQVLIPCHFWTFPLHHGDPQELIDAMPAEAPHTVLRLLYQGEAYVG